MQVIFSCEDNAYMRWQAELLNHTYAKTGMKAPLTALVAAAGEQERLFPGNSLHVSNYKSRCSGEPLMCLNKPGGVAEWAALDGASKETVFLVDPDSVFHCAVPDLGPFPDGHACAQEHGYMAVDIPANKLVLDRHCAAEYRARVQPVGVYIMMNRSDLCELAKLWLQRSIEIASDAVCREALAGTGWLSDMWGYAIASAELGIYHHARGFSQETGWNSLDRPITHYCYPLMADAAERWFPETTTPVLWSKWNYQPWTDAPESAATSCEGRAVLDELRELVSVKRRQATECANHSQP